MPLLSKNILVVVDLESDKKIYIKKIADFLQSQLFTIHLVCIVKSWRHFSSLEIRPPFKEILKGDIEIYVSEIIQLQEWRLEIEKVCSGVEVKMHIYKGFWTIATIVKAVNKICPYILLINRGRRNSFFPFMRSFSPDRLSKKISCRVITVNATSRGQRH